MYIRKKVSRLNTKAVNYQQNELSDTIGIDFPWPNCWGSRRRRGRSLRPGARMLVAFVVSAQFFLLGAPAARDFSDFSVQVQAATPTVITAMSKAPKTRTGNRQPTVGEDDDEDLPFWQRSRFNVQQVFNCSTLTPPLGRCSTC